MKHLYKKRSVLFILLPFCFSILFQNISASAATSSLPTIVVLSQYSAAMNIGEEFYLVAVASTGKLPTYKSSSSRIASVNTYGRVTAKQAGTCRITAKSGNGEASCKVTVKKTSITLNTKSVSLENGESFRLRATTSNGSTPAFSCNKSSVAVIDSNGTITACKPGTATVTIKADKTSATCAVTVKKPTISLNHTSISLFRCQQTQLEATVSSGIKPTWKSNRSSVATVSDTGLVTAQKHGTATISAKADGVTKSCEVTVKSPTIKLSSHSISMKVGKTKKINCTVSSGNTPVIKSSKPNVASIDQFGTVTALSTGTTIISFTEDGVRETCTVKVT